MPRLRQCLPVIFFISLAWSLARPGVAQAEGPALGSSAPEFKLQDQRGAWHELKSYRGKWLALYFYAKDHTPGCTALARDFRDNFASFGKAGTNVVGISVDDVESHKKFAEKNELPFRILADPTKQTAKSYGVLKSYLGAMELAKRDTFLIDPEGRVVRHYTDFEPKGHAEVVLRDLEALQKK